ncbi:MAG TPA: NAD(P)-dependent oxidoreductase [Myxococcales bacterium]|nr:NAD(P)-dependent oxidoreductase [Myxococcales bacterium]HZX65171.1 NAD(P)-dependent oxidoreductase [Myxococcales bacterium]
MAETIGVVGVGLLGSAVSSVLLEAGHPLVVHDLVSEKVEALVKRGARGARSAADVASNARVVFTVLPTLESVEEAIGEVLSAATKETVIVQMSTISPDLAVRMDEAARSRGAALLDAPVSGTSAMVARRDCVITVGGDRSRFDSCRIILEELAKKVFHVGACGMGSYLKLVTNLVMGLNGVVLAEGLTLARRAGLDPAQTLEILRHGAAASKILEVRGPLMVEGRFDAMMKVDLFLKDIRLMLEAGQSLHVPLPLASAMQQFYTAAYASGQAKDDLATVVRVYEAMAGLPPRGRPSA